MEAACTAASSASSCSHEDIEISNNSIKRVSFQLLESTMKTQRVADLIADILHSCGVRLPWPTLRRLVPRPAEPSGD
jgi:hypothetical protein